MAPAQGIPPRSFDAPVTARLARDLGVAMAAAATVMALALVLANKPTLWRGYIAATAVSVLAAGLSLAVLAWGLRGDSRRAVGAYFLAMGVRVLVSLGGCLFAIVVGHFPAAPTLLLMMVYYLVVLCIESGRLAKTLWSAST